MITLKIYNKENKDEVRGGEEEGVLENKWMIFHGLIFFLLSLFPKLDFLCISIYHLLFPLTACHSYSNFSKDFNWSTFMRKSIALKYGGTS